MPETQIKQNRPELFRALIVCTITMLAVSTVFMTQSIFLEISESFNIDIVQARSSFSIASLFYAGAFFFLGPAADKFDLPRIAVGGMLSLSMVVLLASYVTDYHLFIVAMALMGTCAAAIPASMFPYMAMTSPENKVGAYMGSIVAAATLGVVYGRVTTGLMTAGMGWHVSFRVLAVVLFALTVTSFFMLVEKGGINTGNNIKLSRLYVNAIRLFLDLKTLSLLLVGFGLYFGFLGMVTFLTPRLVAPPYSYSAGEVGWISFAGMTGLIAPFSGDISQKIGTFKILIPGLLICLFSFQLMGWFPSISLTILGLLLLFFGVYACQPLVFLLIGESVPRASLGSASSLYILFCIGGGSLSSITLGPVWRFYGWSGITIICSIFLSVSLFMILIIAYKRNISVQTLNLELSDMQKK